MSALETPASLPTPTGVTEHITSIITKKRWRPQWWLGFLISFSFLNLLLIAITWLFIKGVGIWGIRIPIAWGFAITNFVWWVGIGHAGTFISAFLLLLRQDWRNSINRCAEAITLFAIACAGLFPILHLGRPQVFYWLIPYPNTMNLGPQFRSPLIWDMFAIFTYLTVSALFWFLGAIPDLATMRDKLKSPLLKRTYGLLAMGWRGSNEHWKHFRAASLLLAGLATPLVISVHSIVSLDFAVGIEPGWHSTIFPPYFVAGALYSGFAMVLTILIPVRRAYGLEQMITDRHVRNAVFIMMATGIMVGYGYITEIIVNIYSGDIAERHMAYYRFFGDYEYVYWLLLALNFTIPQLLWFPKVRENMVILFILTLFINVGMWLERFIIVVTSTSQDFLPSSWGVYSPTFWDWATLFGSIGLFFSAMFIFIRVVPVLSMNEVKEQFQKGRAMKGVLS